jgi:3-hydroxybutyrate dehydrogenase
MTNHNAPFQGANALIFGAAKGTGKAVAQEWARRGAHVAIADIDKSVAHQAVAEIEAAGGKAFALAADVTSDDSVARTITVAEATFGQVEILMNNVGAALNRF